MAEKFRMDVALPDLAATDWAAQRGLFAEVRPGVRVPAAPWQSSGAAVGAGPVVCALGADNHAVLADWGFAAGDIDAVVEAGALRSPGTAS